MGRTLAPQMGYTESITVPTPIPLHLQEVIRSISEPSLRPVLSSPAT